MAKPKVRLDKRQRQHRRNSQKAVQFAAEMTNRFTALENYAFPRKII